MHGRQYLQRMSEVFNLLAPLMQATVRVRLLHSRIGHACMPVYAAQGGAQQFPAVPLQMPSFSFSLDRTQGFPEFMELRGVHCEFATCLNAPTVKSGFELAQLQLLCYVAEVFKQCVQ